MHLLVSLLSLLRMHLQLWRLPMRLLQFLLTAAHVIRRLLQLLRVLLVLLLLLCVSVLTLLLCFLQSAALCASDFRCSDVIECFCCCSCLQCAT